VSHICALTVVLFGSVTAVSANSTPMVELVLMKQFLIYLINMLDFPTPESPMSMTVDEYTFE
jgi:hypothetical protein